MYDIEQFSISERWARMSDRRRVVSMAHLAITLFCMLFMLVGHPPADPERITASQQRYADNGRDISIVELKDGQDEQQKLNDRLEKHLEANDAEIKEIRKELDDQNAHWNWIEGGLAGLGALSALAFAAQFLQLKRKDDNA